MVADAKSEVKIAIIGGGLAGISAARHALAAGADVTLFEMNSKLGGRVGHEVLDGYVLDAGFQVVNLNYPELKNLMSPSQISSKAIFHKFTYTKVNGERATFSAFHPAHILSRDSGSIREKIAFLKYLVSTSSEPISESAKKFPTFYQTLLAPFLQGVFLTNPATVNPIIAKRIIKYFALGRPQIIDGGVGNLIASLAAPIPSQDIYLESRVTSINRVGERFSLNVLVAGQEITFDNFTAIINATSSPELNEIRENWLSSTTVYHTVPKLSGRHKIFHLGGKFLNSLAISQANPTYAPTNRDLIATTYDQAISPEDWLRFGGEQEQEIAELYGLNASDLQLLKIVSIPKSLPHFSGAINLPPAMPGLSFAGDTWQEPSQNGALASGKIAFTALFD